LGRVLLVAVQEAVDGMVLVVEAWRRKNLWENWSKTPLQVESIRFGIETRKL